MYCNINTHFGSKSSGETSFASDCFFLRRSPTCVFQSVACWLYWTPSIIARGWDHLSLTCPSNLTCGFIMGPLGWRFYFAVGSDGGCSGSLSEALRTRSHARRRAAIARRNANTARITCGHPTPGWPLHPIAAAAAWRPHTKPYDEPQLERGGCDQTSRAVRWRQHRHRSARLHHLNEWNANKVLAAHAARPAQHARQGDPHAKYATGNIARVLVEGRAPSRLPQTRSDPAISLKTYGFWIIF